jgi:hypothetical protein
VTKTKISKNTEKTGKKKRAGRKVWRIFHFQERFEMDEYRRQGGLDYIRMFVTATTQTKSNESTEFFQQLKELRYFYPDMYYSFFGIFWTLGTLTATREDWLRGYLLDGDLQPLSEGKLAARLQISLKETRAALNALKRVGFIELIPCPEFHKPEREKEKFDSQNQTKNRQQNKQKSDTGTLKKAAIREHSETFGNVSELLNNKNGINKRIKTKEEKEINLKTGLNKNPIKTNTNQNSNQEPGANESLEPKSPGQNEKVSTGNEQQTPTQAVKPVEPENPTDSEAGAVVTHHVPTQPRSAYRDGRPQSIGHIISGVFPAHWQDADAEAFGWEIVEALGISSDRSNEHSRSEWGSFAAWFSRLKAAVPSVVYTELRGIAVQKAEYLRKKGKSARNKSAVWFKILNGELSSRGINLPDARASPA